MKRSSLIILTIFFVHTGLFSQSKNKNYIKKIEKADILMDNQRFEEALPIYLSLEKVDSLDSDLNFKIGICYLNSRLEKAKSIQYFEKAVSCKDQCTLKDDKAHLMAFLYLGDAYHSLYKFDDAIATYEKFITLLSPSKDKDLIKEVDRKIAICSVGITLVASPVTVKIENMGNAINSPYADYSPVVTADESTIIFTTRRPKGNGRLSNENGMYFEDIFISHKTDSVWSKAVSIGKPINTDGNEASVGISVDGQIILIYKDDNGDGNIYATSLVGNEWSTPEKLNENINSNAWEPSAYISADGNTLFFTSDRDGGFGGRDLYSSKKSPTGEWATAVNLGATINTEYDEDAPFLHPDGITLYFSSEGHETMGGFDIFSTKMIADNEWSVPVNVGYPINSTDDDIYYVVSPNKQRAYYSSFKANGFGEKDNYMITFETFQEPPLALLSGSVKNTDGNAATDIEIIVTDNETGDLVGIYHPNSKSGEYVFILPPGKNYNVIYEAAGYLFHSKNIDVSNATNYYDIHEAVKLEPLIAGSNIILNNIFFDFDKATLQKTSLVELRKLQKLLTNNPGMVVEISGHTDSVGKEKYNMKLSEQRAQAVVTYLNKQGVNNNQMIAKGYGQTLPKHNNTNADGSDNPKNRQLNRRVELKIVEMN